MSDNILHVICAELAEVKRTLASLHADVQAVTRAVEALPRSRDQSLRSRTPFARQGETHVGHEVQKPVHQSFLVARRCLRGARRFSRCRATLPIPALLGPRERLGPQRG